MKRLKLLHILCSPIEGTPAFKARYFAGDIKLFRFNGQITQRNEIKKKLLGADCGPVGTKVVLTIKRGSQSETFKLTRAKYCYIV